MMDNSSLFKMAHKMTKTVIQAGDDYRATFGLCLKAIKDKALTVADKIVKSFNAVKLPSNAGRLTAGDVIALSKVNFTISSHDGQKIKLNRHDKKRLHALGFRWDYCGAIILTVDILDTDYHACITYLRKLRDSMRSRNFTVSLTYSDAYGYFQDL